MDTKKPEALAQECADYATSLRSTINVVKLEGRTAPISFLRAADLFERAAARIAELETLRTGYNAARLEIESLQARVQELGQQARECSDRKVVQLDARVKELEAQLDAIGAGGVEPLRKRQCLHQIAEPAPLNKATAEHALRRILHIVQRYLPPDGISIDKAMNEIIAVVDPWPAADGDSGMYPPLPRATLFSTVVDDGFAIGNAGVYTPDQMRAYADADRAARAQAAPGLPAVRTEGVHKDAYPGKCPITGRGYFMTLEHPELGTVPTYGGPYDSYTIPAPDGEPTDPWHERELRCERYDHDAGDWVEGGEPIPLRIIHDDVLFKLEADAEAATKAAPAAGVTAGAVPDGWKLVPVEPTPEMLGAGLRYVDGRASMPFAYHAMLAAAPQPPEAASVCKECDGTGTVAGGQAHFACSECAAPARQQLTVEQIRDFYGDNNNFDLTGPYVIAFARAVEAAHGITAAPNGDAHGQPT